MERLRLILLGLAGLVAVGLMLQDRYPGLRPAQAVEIAAGGLATPVGGEPVYLSNPDTGPYFSALKAALPDEYRGIVRQISTVPGVAAPVAAPEALAFAMRSLREDYGVLAGRAPIANLDQIIDAQRAILAALATKDPAACVDFYQGRPSAALAAFTSNHNKLMLDLGQADLAAITAGRSHQHDPERPTPADFTALTEALKQAGLSPETIGLLVDGRQPAQALSDADLCKSVGAYLTTLRALAPDIRQRLIARSVILAAAS